MEAGRTMPMGEQKEIPLCPQWDVSVHLVDGGAVLFEQDKQSLYTTNATAAAVWYGLQDSAPPAAVAGRLAERFSIDLDTARAYVAQTLRQWRKARGAVRTGWGRQSDLFEQANADRLAVVRQILTPSKPMALTAHYRLLDSIISIRYETYELAHRTHEVFGHLWLDEPLIENTISFDVVQFDGGVALTEGGDVIEFCTDESQAVAMVRACVIDRALEESGDFAALHAAAATRDGRCILFPGASGAGKSSLIAGLAAEGYTLFGDDTVTISRDDFSIRPVPCGICVKKSGWDLLAPRFPEIRVAPVHGRPDNNFVRYLTPPTIKTANTEDKAEVGWIVFPRFTPDSSTEFIPLSGIGALERLLACFLPLGGGLDNTDVERLVDWVSTTPSFELRTSSLTDTVRLLSFL